AHDRGNFPGIVVGHRLRSFSQVFQGGFGTGHVPLVDAGCAQRKELVDVFERALSLHLLPRSALDDAPRAHRPELALERNRAEAAANLAFGVLLRGPAEAGHYRWYRSTEAGHSRRDVRQVSVVSG